MILHRKTIISLPLIASLIIPAAFGQDLTNSAKSYDHSILLSQSKSPNDFSYARLSENTDDPIVNYYNGIHMMNAQKPEKAEQYFNKVLEHQPPRPEVYHWLCRVSIMKGDYRKAVEMGTRSLQLNPDQFKTHLDLFVAYGKLGLNQEAHHHLLAASQIDPEYVSKRAARLIIENDDLQSAMYLFSVVFEAVPENILNGLNYGRSLIMVGDTEKAEQVLASAYGSNTPDSDHFELLYTMYFNMLLENGRISEILNGNHSQKVGRSFYHQYYYKAMGYFHRGDIDRFSLNANLYFLYQGKNAPPSLMAWAISNNKNIDRTSGD